MSIDAIGIRDIANDTLNAMRGVPCEPAKVAFAFDYYGLRFQIWHGETHAVVSGMGFSTKITAAEMRAMYLANQGEVVRLHAITNMHGATWWGTKEEYNEMRAAANQYQREYGRAWNE